MDNGRGVPLVLILRYHRKIGPQLLLPLLALQLFGSYNGRNRGQKNLAAFGGCLLQGQVQLPPGGQGCLKEFLLGDAAFGRSNLLLQLLHLLAELQRLLGILSGDFPKGNLRALGKEAFLCPVGLQRLDALVQPGEELFFFVDVGGTQFHLIPDLLIAGHGRRVAELDTAAFHQAADDLLPVLGQTAEENTFHFLDHVAPTILSTISAAAPSIRAAAWAASLSPSWAAFCRASPTRASAWRLASSRSFSA